MSVAARGETPLEADFIIVGAGSAGCVLADRLSADGRSRVLLLEAGGDDRPLRNLSQFRSILNLRIPAGFTRILGDPAVDWRYLTERDPNTGRQYVIHRGKVLGGSSSINGLLYVRGQPQDYDGWRQLGCVGWGWEDVLPYFRRAERHEEGESAMHGGGGPLSIATPRHEDPVTFAGLEAWRESGLPLRRNINGTEQEGAGLVAMTARRGSRHSTATAYLHPAMRRGNLRVETHAQAAGVVFEGRRAVGVRFRKHGAEVTALARREVILCGGAINSPQLLQLSGVGPAPVLREADVPVLHDSPEIGRNLQDHYSAMMVFRLKPEAGGFNALSRGLPLRAQILRYVLAGRGLLTIAGAHATAFARSRPELDAPDLQFFMSPASVDAQLSAKSGCMVLETEPGLTMAGYAMRPRSSGTVFVRSGDPEAAPAITPNYLADPYDRQATVAALRWMRRVGEAPALRRYVERELAPTAEAETDEELLACAVAGGNTSFHQTGSCAMGPEDRSATDPALRVRGVQNLRVADASVMPRITSGNTNAPVIMIAEKAADLILGR